MMGNSSNAGPLTLGMEEKTVVIAIANENPLQNRLVQSRLTCHYFVDSCWDSGGADIGEKVGRETGDV